jgi:UDP-N-acetylglucosamine 2-epimerase (non-hydrolysing)
VVLVRNTDLTKLRLELGPMMGGSAPGLEAGSTRNGTHSPPRRKIGFVFGTRPEVIKLAPVIAELETWRDFFEVVTVNTGQHTDLLAPFVQLFATRIDHNLRVMEPGQTPNRVCARVLAAIDPILTQERPDLLLVQGDTTTALAGALAGFHQRIPVGHVEAGLRSGDVQSPYPEEMNRRLITRLATYHFAATTQNRATLLAEGVRGEQVFITGNPVVDSLHTILARRTDSPGVAALLRATEGLKRIVLTTHRRESFGDALAENLRVLRDFVSRHEDVALLFPIHPNPAVRGPATAILGGRTRIHLLDPLDYADFIGLLARAWLIVSDSGGVQEEAPTLGKPLLVLRENTERPEAVESGVARLVGGSPANLGAMLESAYQDGDWIRTVTRTANPFGRGDAAQRIVHAIAHVFGVAAARRPLVPQGLRPGPQE